MVPYDNNQQQQQEQEQQNNKVHTHFKGFKMQSNPSLMFQKCVAHAKHKCAVHLGSSPLLAA